MLFSVLESSLPGLAHSSGAGPWLMAMPSMSSAHPWPAYKCPQHSYSVRLGRSVWRWGRMVYGLKERIRDLHSIHVNNFHHPYLWKSPLKLINLLLVFFSFLFFLAYVILSVYHVWCVLCPEGPAGRSSPAALLYDDTDSWHLPAVIHTPEPTVSPGHRQTLTHVLSFCHC